MLIYIGVWLISLVICIIVTRLVFEIPKFSKRADEISDINRVTTELLHKQNEILTLLLHVSFEGKK
jgi:hypothetical protein